ncbi:unnamed protein product [Camellia sinensis]
MRSARNTSTTSTSRNFSTSPPPPTPTPTPTPSPASTPPSTPTSTPLSRIRRTKARLLEEVPKLERLAIKKVKGLSTEELAARNDLVLALPDRIQAILDGTAAAPKQSGGWTGSASHTEIKFDSANRRVQPIQDQGLEVISEGLDTLKNMAHDLNGGMDRQIDKVASDLKNTNVRLKDTVNQ